VKLELSKAKYPVSIAPMMDWTDRNYRFFMRQISKKTLLYTEMVTTGAILFGDKARHLDFSEEELPVALQLGGDDPQALAQCAKLGEEWGYTEINLNVGCPSSRVQNGNFGACLMAQPELVSRCVAAMKKAVNIPVTVKHRIGIDELDKYEDMYHFVHTVAQAGADRFTVHARKAWLNGLSPKENRTIPPLRYPDVYKLKQALPELELEINGGIKTHEAIKQQLGHVDAVMIGRAAYENPYLFALVDQVFYGMTNQAPSRQEVVLGMLDYAEQQMQKGKYLNTITRHMLSLFNGKPGAKAWRRAISENVHKQGVSVDLLSDALKVLPEDALNERPKLEALITS